MLTMGTFGGRRAVACASALLAVLLPGSLLTACSDPIDQSHTVQTQLNRIDAVTDAQVTTPSDSTGAVIEVVYNDDPTARELAALVKEIDAVTDREDYPSYRLDLVPAQDDGDRLTVDDTFVDSDDRSTVLENWLSTTSVLLGDVHYTFEPGTETIEVEAGPGILHDVGEASRIGYGYAGTEWTFRNGDTSFVVSGRVSPTDVDLFQDVQRSVSSEVLPAPATAWRLERRARQVLLDLDVGLEGTPVPPARVTIPRYGEAVSRLASAAMTATEAASLPVTLRLINPGAAGQGDDVFGYWVSDERPVRGRDPLVRGWDLWLEKLAG